MKTYQINELNDNIDNIDNIDIGSVTLSDIKWHGSIFAHV